MLALLLRVSDLGELNRDLLAISTLVMLDGNLGLRFL